MSRQRVANGATPIAGLFPGSLITTPNFWTAAGTSTKTVQDETISINATGLMELDFRPVVPGAVEVYDATGKGGNQFTVRTDQIPLAGLEVLVEPNGHLTFHADEFSTTAYAWYEGRETIITGTIMQQIYEELRALSMNGGGLSIGKANESLTIGDCCLPLGQDSFGFWVWGKALPPLPAFGVCTATAAQNAETGFLMQGLISGLSPSFGTGYPPLYVSTSSTLTTTALGSVPTVKQIVGRGISNGKAAVNFHPWPQVT